MRSNRLSTPAASAKLDYAEYLLQRTWPLKAGETCLFHAAAGGVGLIFGQWARAIGATVIGTVSSAEKAELALAHGYTHVINYREENVLERVLEITDGARLPVDDQFFDGVVSFEVLEHVDDERASLAEIFRVTRPGGWLAISGRPAPSCSWRSTARSGASRARGGTWPPRRRARLPRLLSALAMAHRSPTCRRMASPSSCSARACATWSAIPLLASSVHNKSTTAVTPKAVN